MKAARDLLEQRLEYLQEHRERLVIDADTHISDTANMAPHLKQAMEATDNYYHGRPVNAEDLLTEMKMAGVSMCLTWQNPAATFYPGTERENFEALLQANRYIFETSVRYPERFIPAGWTDPKAMSMDLAKEIATKCVREFGFSIVKLNPAQNEFMIDGPEVEEMVEHIIGLGATPAFHFGADTPFTPVSGLQKLAERFASQQIIAIHMGGGGAAYTEAEGHYTEARSLGLKQPNVKYILSAKRDTHIESDLITYELAGEPFNRNLCCASDAPYGRQTWNFGGYRAMFRAIQRGEAHTDPRIRQQPGLFTEEAVQRYMGTNFADIVIESIESALSKPD